MATLAHPPKLSAAFASAERLRYIAWLAGLTLERISHDDSRNPLVAKAPVVSLFRCVAAVAGEPAERLEAARAELEKPYDAARDYNSVLVPQEWLDLLANLAGR